MSVEDEARIVEFKLILAELTEEYVRRRLSQAARAQGRRLPKQTESLLRTGALAAVARLDGKQLGAFAQGKDWHSSVAHAIESGAWGELIAATVRYAFMPDAS